MTRQHETTDEQKKYTVELRVSPLSVVVWAKDMEEAVAQAERAATKIVYSTSEPNQ